MGPLERLLIRRPGGHAALELVSEPDPAPGPGRVLVRVAASGVNYADVVVRMGHYEAAKGLYPITPGFEFAGTVEDPGDSGFQAGDRVLGVTLFGGCASWVAADARLLWPCPPGWSFEECAGFPAVHLTAYYGLFRAAKVEAGETVLIHSAAGGVGCALVQLARAAGCRAVGVVGASNKAELARQLGAEVIDRSAQDLWREADRLSPGGFDAIFDANGVTTPRPGFARLTPGGRLVVYGFGEIVPRGSARPSLARLAFNWLKVPRFSPLEMTTTNRAVMGFNLAFLFDKVGVAREAMARMLLWAREGKLHRVPTTAFPAREAARAHAALESGKTVGKLVLTWR